jgi:RNA recognition motif-containing protein
MRDEDTGACRGIGFVNFLKRSEALGAINALNGRVAAGSGSDRVLQISLQSPRWGLHSC